MLLHLEVTNLFLFYFLFCFLGGKTPDPSARTYKTIIKETALSNEEVRSIYIF